MVEDDILISANIKRYLSQHSIATDIAENIKDGLSKSTDEEYDMILIDRMLPDGDGLELCKSIRENEYIKPILMLTALGEPEEIVKGLDFGADDYLPKPFLMEVLLARIRALARRLPSENLSPNLEIADLVINTNTQEVRRGGKLISLTPKEYSLICFLVRNKNIAFDRVTIYSRVWNEEADLFSNSLDVHIRNLRNKIDSKSRKRLIRTVRNVGYMVCDK